MKTIGLKEVLSKKIVPTILVAGMIMGISSCGKGGMNKDVCVSETTITDINKEESLSIKVYSYSHKSLVANVLPVAVIGEEIELAMNDELANNSVDAMNGNFTTKISDCKYAKPGEKVEVLAIAGMDENKRNHHVSYRGGVSSLDFDDYYLSYLVGNETGQLGWVSYKDSSLALVEEVVKESLESEAPAGFSLVDIREESDVNYYPDDDFVITRQYLLK